MRFITRFVLVLLGAVVLVGAAYGIYVEGRAQWAAWQLKRDFSLVKQLATRPVHYKDCLSDTSSDLSTVLRGYQLRFENETSYVVEAVCGTSRIGPIVVREATLPMAVKKISGSGVFAPAPLNEPLNARVLITSGYRRLAVGFLDNLPITTFVSADTPWQDYGAMSATASCEGWGYRCCNELTQVGAGHSENNVRDCSGSCYQRCLDKPFLIFFATDPIMNTATRVAEVHGSRASVAFSYAVDDSDGDVAKTTLSFGDGAVFEDTEGQGSAIHEYTCNRSVCDFNATISSVDSDNLGMPESRMSQVTIRVIRN